MANVYEKVTERIISKLEEGIIPWEQPWVGGRNGAFNRVTKKSYSFLNQLLLGKPGEYATMKQWNKLGGVVKTGEKANLVVFWKPKKVMVKSDDDAECLEDGDDEEVKTKTIPILKYYYVFHIDQVEGVEPLKAEEYPDVVVPDGDAESVIADYLEREGVKFTEKDGGDESYYKPSTDSIVMPMKKQFKSTNEYYSTVFHEMTHSTGHPKRLNRIDLGAQAAFGSENYGKEELVAEIGAATIMNSLNLETESSFRNNTAYIQNWLKALKNDNRMIVSASSKAGKAVDYIFGEKKNMEVDKSVKNENKKEVKKATENKPKKKRRSHEEVIIDRVISQAKKNKNWKEPENYDLINLDGEEYYGFSDGHMIMASKNAFGHEPKETQNKSFSNLFEPMEYAKFSNLEYIKTDIANVKKFVKEHGNDGDPYIFHTNKGCVGVNPNYFVDMVDFMEGTEEFYINPEAKYTKDGYYTGMLYFGDTVDQKIGILLPVVLRPTED